MLNKVTLIGNVGAEPEGKFLPSGEPVSNLRIATSEQWKDKQGNKQERTEWHSVVFFGKLAEIVNEYAHKGKQIYVEGSLRTRKWQDKEGNDRYTTEIVGKEMKLLGNRTGDAEDAPRKAPAKPQKADDEDNSVPF